MRKNVLIFAKAPRIGTVKQRLSNDIGLEAAWCFYRRTVRNLILRLALDPRWFCYLVVTPDSIVSIDPFWLNLCSVIKQGSGDIGQRMRRALASCYSNPTVLVGSDIPEVTGDHIQSAFKALASNDVVLGPAEDGGYWLVGLSSRAIRSNPFSGVAWSSPEVLAETVSNVPINQSISILDKLDDIDNGKDYKHWLGRLALQSKGEGIIKKSM